MIDSSEQPDNKNGKDEIACASSEVVTTTTDVVRSSSPSRGMKPGVHLGVQDICQKLKLQLEELSSTIVDQSAPKEEKAKRNELMEQLKQQLAELST